MAGKVASGGGGKRSKAPGVNSDPNVIPFIDIMLVMLIIFMVAAPPPTVDIKVDLPPPNVTLVHNEDQDKATTVTLVEAAGSRHLFIDKTEVFSNNFDTELMRIAAINNPSKANDLENLFVNAKIYVDADQTTEYSNVIDLINEIDQTGFKKVSLLVKSAQG